MAEQEINSTTMQFEAGQQWPLIYDGEQIGRVEAKVIDPGTEKVTHVAVRFGAHICDPRGLYLLDWNLILSDEKTRCITICVPPEKFRPAIAIAPVIPDSAASSGRWGRELYAAAAPESGRPL